MRDWKGLEHDVVDAISTDNVDPEVSEGAQRWSIESVRRFMVVFGLVSTAFNLLTFVVLLKVFEAGEVLVQSTWFVVSLLTEVTVVLVLRSAAGRRRVQAVTGKPNTVDRGHAA